MTAARLGRTACEATAWESVTSITSSRAKGVSGTVRVALTAGARAATLTSALSYNAPLILANAEILSPAAGNTVFELDAASSLVHVGVVDYTVSARFGATGCESSVWLSDTQVAGTSPSGFRVGPPLPVAVTVGQQVAPPLREREFFVDNLLVRIQYCEPLFQVALYLPSYPRRSEQ